MVLAVDLWLKLNKQVYLLMRNKKKYV